MHYMSKSVVAPGCKDSMDHPSHGDQQIDVLQQTLTGNIQVDDSELTGILRHVTFLKRTALRSTYSVDRDNNAVHGHILYKYSVHSGIPIVIMIFSDCQPFSRDFFPRRFRLGRFPSLFSVPCPTAFRIRLCQSPASTYSVQSTTCPVHLRQPHYSCSSHSSVSISRKAVLPLLSTVSTA